MCEIILRIIIVLALKHKSLVTVVFEFVFLSLNVDTFVFICCFPEFMAIKSQKFLMPCVVFWIAQSVNKQSRTR